jgi:hypothetical protein
MHRDREQALRLASVRALAACGTPGIDGLTGPQRRAWDKLCPLYAMLDTRGWTKRERAQLVELVRAKGAASERKAAHVMAAHPRLLQSLQKIAARSVANRRRTPM